MFDEYCQRSTGLTIDFYLVVKKFMYLLFLVKLHVINHGSRLGLRLKLVVSISVILGYYKLCYSVFSRISFIMMPYHLLYIVTRSIHYTNILLSIVGCIYWYIFLIFICESDSNFD